MIRVLGFAVIAALLLAAPVAMAAGDAVDSAEAKQEIQAEGTDEAVEQPGPAADDEAADHADHADHAEAE